MIMNALLKQELDKTTILVEKEIKKLLPSSMNEENILHNSMKYSVLAKSKRIRAFLIMQTAKLFDIDSKDTLKLASAIEFIHAYSLIHDDLPVMDNSDMRRGQASNHIKYDEATALLAGDALIPFAYEILSNPETIANAEIRCEIIKELSKAIGPEGMVAGQYLDLLSEKRPLSYRTMCRMQELKTGKMFIFCCLTGAILGKANIEQKKALYEYAKNFGIAFQITDDILDIVGDEKIVGKNLKRDKNKNKTTFISLYSLEQAKVEAEKLVDNACKALDIFETDTTVLKELAKFLLIRTH